MSYYRPRVSPTVLVIAAVVAVWLASAFGVWHYGTSRYAAGRRSVMQAVQFDSALLTTTRRHAVEATARTDTVVRRVLVTRYRVDTLMQRVPDTLRVVPEIAALSGMTGQLLAQIDTLAHTLDVERAVSRLRTDADGAALVAARVVIVTQADAIVGLGKRPTRRTAAYLAAGGAVLGFAAGVFR